MSRDFFGRRFQPTQKRRGTSRRQERNDFKINEQEREQRYRQLLSFNIDPRYELRSNAGRANVKIPDSLKGIIDERKYNERLPQVYSSQVRNEKINWKSKGVNPITVNLPAQVFPYGGGIAPHRKLTKQELVSFYLGSRAIAKITLLYQQEYGRSVYSEEDIQEAKNRLIKGDNVDGFMQPLLPYPVFNPDISDGIKKAGTIEEAVFYNKQWWNENAEGLKFEPVTDTQGELTDTQVNAVWETISSEVYPKLGEALLNQEIGREREVPQIGNKKPVVIGSDGRFEDAVHGFDIDGTINSARNQELISLVGKELRIANEQKRKGDRSPELQERISLLDDTSKTLAKERIAEARWDSGLKNDEERKYTVEEIGEDEVVSGDNFMFWGAPIEHRDLFDQSQIDDHKVEWHNNYQTRTANLGAWETNYLNPEFEPGMFAAPKNIEYRTYGVTDLYLDKTKKLLKKQGEDLDTSTIENRYIVGKLDPTIARPKKGDVDREAFDRSVIEKTLNTTNSKQYKREIALYEAGALGDGEKTDQKASALFINSPNANKKRLEEVFAEDDRTFANFKTSRHDFAKNLARDSDEEFELLYTVRPLSQDALINADSRSIEEDLRDSPDGRRIWAEYARVKGDSKGGYSIRQ